MHTETILIVAGATLLMAGIGGGLLGVFSTSPKNANNNHDTNTVLDANHTLGSGFSGISFGSASTSCTNSNGKVLVRNRLRGCNWIAINFPVACNRSEEVRQYCPLTCNTCPDRCLDVAGEFVMAGQNLTCNAGTNNNYCSNLMFANNCPMSCDLCWTSITSSPSSSENSSMVPSALRPPSLNPTQIIPKSSSPTRTLYYTTSSNPSQVTAMSWVSIGNSIYGGTADNSGLAVSLSTDGQTVFVGEPGAGLVRSFTRNIQTLKPKGLAIGNSYDPWFGSCLASSHDGSVVVVSSYKYDNYRGLVRVYVWDGLKWIKLGNDLFGDENGDWFGWDVDISKDGRSIIVGVYLENSSSGYARVFDIEPSGWKKRGEDLVGDITAAFGFSVAISSDGSVAAIGAPEGSYTEVYILISGRWSLLGNRIRGSTGAHFGNSVALSSKDGLVLAVGADLINSERGAVYVYEWRHLISEWQLRGNDAAIYGEDQNDFLGGRISISEDGNVVAYNSQSKVGVLVWNGSAWRKQGSIIAKGPTSVSLSGDGKILAVGIPHDDTIDFGSGTTAIYKWQ